MIYLLDVNALLALGVQEHEFHERTANWVKRTAAGGDASFATCAITELGFLRVLVQSAYAGYTVPLGVELLERLKSMGLDFVFLVDDQGAAELPRWVRWPKQVTDGHLVALAKAHRAVLATLDEGIRGALVIPR